MLFRSAEFSEPGSYLATPSELNHLFEYERALFQALSRRQIRHGRALTAAGHGCCVIAGIARRLLEFRVIHDAREAIVPNRDEVKGKVQQITGKVKEGIGRATNNPNLVVEGMDDQDAGTIREGLGTAKRKIGNAVQKLGKEIKK